MKKLLSVIAIIILVAAFYVAWPAWSGYQVYNAIKTKDTETLERKIDFSSVRVSLRNAASEKISELYVPPQDGPSSPALIERLKRDAVSGIVDRSLESLVTADNLIRITSEGGSLKDSVERMLRDQMSRGAEIAGKTGLPRIGAGKGGTVIRTVPSGGPTPAPLYGLGNVKHLGMVAPFRFAVSIAKNAAAPEADVIVEVSFTGTDWKVTGVKPRL